MNALFLMTYTFNLSGEYHAICGEIIGHDC